jgi:malate dehydrogenase
MTRDDLFKINAGIVRDLVTGIAKFCPKAFILIISNPVNSTVPIAAEILKAHKVFDPSRLFGVTTLDVVRASTFTAQITGEKDSRKIVVPVIGGHSGETIVPLLSLAKPPCDIPADKLDGLVHRKLPAWHLIFSGLSSDNLVFQVSSSEVTRSLRLRTVVVQPPCRWRLLGSGA